MAIDSTGKAKFLGELHEVLSQLKDVPIMPERRAVLRDVALNLAGEAWDQAFNEGANKVLNADKVFELKGDGFPSGKVEQFYGPCKAGFSGSEVIKAKQKVLDEKYSDEEIIYNAARRCGGFTVQESDHCDFLEITIGKMNHRRDADDPVVQLVRCIQKIVEGEVTF
jgi:hypothetical protein